VDKKEVGHWIHTLLENHDATRFSAIQLEAIACYLYDLTQGLGSFEELEDCQLPLAWNTDDYELLLRKILMIRAKKMNTEFVWTDEKKRRLIEIDGKLTDAFRKAYDEAIQEAKILEDRITLGDRFLSYYKIKVSIAPYIGASQDGMEEFVSVLCDPCDFRPISYQISHTSFADKYHSAPEYIKPNWNIQRLAKQYPGDEAMNCLARVFPDTLIGASTYALLDPGLWSFSDILNIKSISSDAEITRRNKTVLPEQF
jgi:hypothetical protein